MGKAFQSAIVSFTPAADYKAKAGYLVNLAGETATISTSATAPAKGVIVDGNETTAGYATEKVSVAILGGEPGAVYMRAGGAITKGDLVIQHSDGTVLTDSGSGARVGVGIALEDGVAGENIAVVAITPRIYAS